MKYDVIYISIHSSIQPQFQSSLFGNPGNTFSTNISNKKVIFIVKNVRCFFISLWIYLAFTLSNPISFSTHVENISIILIRRRYVIGRHSFNHFLEKVERRWQEKKWTLRNFSDSSLFTLRRPWQLATIQVGRNNCRNCFMGFLFPFNLDIIDRPWYFLEGPFKHPRIWGFSFLMILFSEERSCWKWVSFNFCSPLNEWDWSLLLIQCLLFCTNLYI